MNPTATSEEVTLSDGMADIIIEPRIAEITMPENLRVGRIVSDHRQECQLIECEFDYYWFAFGQSPFPVPEPYDGEQTLTHFKQNPPQSESDEIKFVQQNALR